jgi:tetratricopeptide (TPR) repeat protein
VLQRRVEFASRIGDKGLMVDTYIDLAEALVRSGSETKARAMYERVLDLDPENEAAREALGDAAVEDAGAVDLDAILRELDEETGAATGPVSLEMDESFANMLSQFKARVTEQDGSEDAGDHYDLGLAFKEMGLIDEAIAEFQTALTGGEERLKVYEELGQCFILKGQYNVAIKVLKRALQVPRQADTDLLGVYYHLGQCHEELGQRAEARSAYETVLAIDPTVRRRPQPREPPVTVEPGGQTRTRAASTCPDPGAVRAALDQVEEEIRRASSSPTSPPSRRSTTTWPTPAASCSAPRWFSWPTGSAARAPARPHPGRRGGAGAPGHPGPR